MQSLDLKTLLESLLFVADEPVTAKRLAEVLRVQEGEVKKALRELQAEYSRRGIRIQQQGDKFQMVTAPEAAPFVEKLLTVEPARKLSQAALETLAIIAYRQPVTRAQIEAIRGVNSDGVLRTLLSKGLIQEVGHLEQPGRPVLYGTTFEFLRYFGLESLSDLPPLDSEGMEKGETPGKET